jgi:HD superfamily phosphohydrolase YqeK
MRCPGQDPMFWKPGDVFEISCPKCGYRVEFFKFDVNPVRKSSTFQRDGSHGALDPMFAEKGIVSSSPLQAVGLSNGVKRKCRCGHEMINPKIDFGCAEWCSYGDSCIEGLPEEMKVRQKEEKNHRLRERISSEMRRYFGPDMKRVNHALKVVQYAEEILKIEGGHPLVVLGAAYLHDIGIKQAEEKYGSPSAEHQEKMGPDIARDILNRLNVQRGIVEEICDIIGHHHYPRKTETLHFQILYEADWLVNMEENGLLKNPEKLQEIIEKNFRTVTGKKLASEFFTQA